MLNQPVETTTHSSICTITLPPVLKPKCKPKNYVKWYAANLKFSISLCSNVSLIFHNVRGLVIACGGEVRGLLWPFHAFEAHTIYWNMGDFRNSELVHLGFISHCESSNLEGPCNEKWNMHLTKTTTKQTKKTHTGLQKRFPGDDN